MSIQNFNQKSQFDDDQEEDGEDEVGASLSTNKIHIRIQQRNGRKTITTVQGIEEKYDKKKLIRFIKKQYNCNGTVIEDEQYGEVMQLQGDQRENCRQFLTEIKMCKPELIKVHGF